MSAKDLLQKQIVASMLEKGWMRDGGQTENIADFMSMIVDFITRHAQCEGKPISWNVSAKTESGSQGKKD